MIEPHGSKELKPLYVNDAAPRAALAKEAEGLPSIVISSGAAASAVMLASGYFTPLDGYMNLAESLSVAKEMELTNGLLWPVPVVNIAPGARLPAGVKAGTRLALRDPNVPGEPVIAVQEVRAAESLSAADQATIIEQVFRTSDEAHPGVAAFKAAGDTLISGPIQVLNYSYFPGDFPDTFAPRCSCARRWRRRAGRRWWPSRPATPCTWPTRSCAASPRRRWVPTASLSTCS